MRSDHRVAKNPSSGKRQKKSSDKKKSVVDDDVDDANELDLSMQVEKEPRDQHEYTWRLVFKL